MLVWWLKSSRLSCEAWRWVESIVSFNVRSVATFVDDDPWEKEMAFKSNA